MLVLQVQRHRSQGEVADVSLEQVAPATGVSLAAEVRTEIQELPFPLHLESQEEPGDDSETAGQAEPPLQEVPLRVPMKRISSSLLTDAILQELIDSDVSLLIIPRHAPLQGRRWSVSCFSGRRVKRCIYGLAMCGLLNATRSWFPLPVARMPMWR